MRKLTPGEKWHKMEIVALKEEWDKQANHFVLIGVTQGAVIAILLAIILWLIR